MNPFVGMALGLILCYSTINGASGLEIFSFLVPSVTYNSTVFPVLLGVTLMSFVENGLGAMDNREELPMIQDDYRIKYLKQHIEAIKKASTIDGVEVMGYLAWGFIDIVSGTTGEMNKRYG